MIKPSAMADGHAGPILTLITGAGFSIRAMKLVHLSKQQAGAFYAVHKDRPFYSDLVGFMSSGPVIAAILEKEDAVNAFREFIGATDPSKAAEGTVRQRYGKNVQENAVHGSDSDENALIESNFFFSGLERV